MAAFPHVGVCKKTPAVELAARMNRTLFAFGGFLFFYQRECALGGWLFVPAPYLCSNVYICEIGYSQNFADRRRVCNDMGVCVFQSLDIPVKTHIPQSTHVVAIYSPSSDVTLETNGEGVGGWCLKKKKKGAPLPVWGSILHVEDSSKKFSLTPPPSWDMWALCDLKIEHRQRTFNPRD